MIGRSASASVRINTTWTSVSFDWRMGTSWLGWPCARKFSIWTAIDEEGYTFLTLSVRHGDLFPENPFQGHFPTNGQ